MVFEEYFNHIVCIFFMCCDREGHAVADAEQIYFLVVICFLLLFYFLAMSF
jgi:hypothetical protein